MLFNTLLMRQRKPLICSVHAEDDRKIGSTGITPTGVIPQVNIIKGDPCVGTRNEGPSLGRPFVLRMASSLCGYRDLIENVAPLLARACRLGILVEDITGDQREGHRGLSKDHLFVGGVDLAPA